MRAIGYTRVSTQEQSQEGISLENQQEKIRAYASLKNLSLVGVVSDAGKSGKNMERTGIQQIINQVINGGIDAVIVYKLDRLSRNTRDTLEIIELLEANNVSFHCITENIDTKTAAGKFFLTIISALAQMERDQISERTVDVLTYKKEKGEWLGKVPLGYRYNKETMKLEEDPAGMKIIQKAKRLRRMGLSLANIGRRLEIGKTTIHKVVNCNLRTYKAIYSNALA